MGENINHVLPHGLVGVSDVSAGLSDEQDVVECGMCKPLMTYEVTALA